MTFSVRARIVQTGALVAAALLAAGAAAPLQAATVSQQNARQPAPNANANAERRICVRMEMPSTRLARRVCRTRAEWDALGGVPGSD